MGQTGCLRYIYMSSARVEGCEYLNHYRFSFGLDDRYLILIVTKCYRDIGTCHNKDRQAKIDQDRYWQANCCRLRQAGQAPPERCKRVLAADRCTAE